MKYALKVQAGSEVRLRDVVNILPQHQADPLAWLAKQFPGYVGWFRLMQEECGNGAVEQPDGSFVQPVIPPPPIQYRQITRAILDDMLEAVFGDVRYSAILVALPNLTTNGWLAARRKLDNPGWTPSRQQIIDLLTALRQADIPTAGTKITVAEITAIAGRPEWIAPN